MRLFAPHLIGHLIGYDFSDSPRFEPFLRRSTATPRASAWPRWAAFWTRWPRKPRWRVLLEDLHWADDSSLDALDLAQTLSKTSLFVLAAAPGPELYSARPRSARAGSSSAASICAR